MNTLVHYNAACRALAEAKAVDEVKDVRDKAEAMRIYAKQAKNRELEVDAAEIRIRAERRLGELITAQKKTVGLNEGGRPKTGSVEEPVSERPPTLAEAGIDKKLSSRSQKLAALPENEFDSRLSEWRAGAEKEGERVSVQLVRDKVQTDKRERRAAREAELADKILALPQKKYGVILADPEWRFEPWSRETGLDRAADNHYSTSETQVIASRDVSSIAAKDCVLFLWATVPMLPQALSVMEAWGFEYRSNFVWVKDRIGTGYWNRNAHELLLIGARGDVPAPAPGTQWNSAIDAPVGKHSEKPETFLDLIEVYFPTLPKIELNRRGPPRHGWDAWGNEAQEEDAA